jgi:Polyketide cyclase / dehydrase and lipid transport
MVTPLVLQRSRTYPLPVEEAFDAVLYVPLEQVFNRRYGPIPAIRATENPDEVWGKVGQSRTIRLTDGGSMREELTGVDRPTAFTYRLSDMRGPMKPLASHVDGRWAFAAAGTGTRITWHWTAHPRSGG